MKEHQYGAPTQIFQTIILTTQIYNHKKQIMVLGKAGMRLEAQKFIVYLMIPITASMAFNEPTIRTWAADYFQLMKYPSNPKTNLKDEYEGLKKQRDEEIEWEARMTARREAGREEYQKQLKLMHKLNAPNTRGGGSGGGADEVDSDTTVELRQQRRGWFNWARGWRRGADSRDNNSLE
jgi:hypothetical protein